MVKLENSLDNGIKLGRITLPERDYACSLIPSELKVKTLRKGTSLIKITEETPLQTLKELKKKKDSLPKTLRGEC